MLIKRFSIILLCCIIAFCPLLTIHSYSYAENNTWQTVDSKSAFMAAVKAYANANYKLNTVLATATYNDPINQAMLNWSYKTLAISAAAANVDLNELQQNIQYRVNENGVLQFLYSGSYIQYLNSLITRYMIDHNIDPDGGEQEERIYSGKLFSDDEDNVCFVFYLSQPYHYCVPESDGYTPDRYITKYGTALKYSNQDLCDMIGTNNTINFTINENNYSSTLYSYNNIYNTVGFSGTLTDYMSYCFGSPTGSNTKLTNIKADGYPSVGIYNNNYYLIFFTENRFYYKQYSKYYTGSSVLSISYLNPGNKAVDAAVDLAKMGLSNVLTEQGKDAAVSVGNRGTQIANDAINDYLSDYDYEEPVLDPDVQNQEPANPSEPETPSGSVPTGGIQLPDGSFNFKMPELNINWSLEGLQNKFPLSIPWDMIRIASALDATAATPEFDFTVNFTRYTHRFQFDLHAFDTIMGYFRIAIEVLYTFGLIVATRQIFHIY